MGPPKKISKFQLLTGSSIKFIHDAYEDMDKTFWWKKGQS